MISHFSLGRWVRRRRSRRFVAVPLLVLALALPVAGCGTASSADPGASALTTSIKKDRYQAVILANDRVYFGHLKALKGDWFELRDAFFIRQKPALTKGAKPTQQVAPISQELQRPDTVMVIRGSQVVNVENLQSSSPVATAIDNVRSARGTTGG